MLIGLISDTHGLLRPEVFTAFEGVDHIVHSGDVGDADILLELSAIAPVSAVWGNTDGMELRSRLPEIATIELAGRTVTVVHGHREGRPDARQIASRYSGDLVVFGHSHQPEIRYVGSTLVVNPGSAGPARFTLPVCVALVTIGDGGIDAKRVDLV